MVGFLIAALFLVALGFGAMRVSRYEGSMADAQQSLATQDYDRSREALDEAEPYASTVQWVPGIGSDPINDVRARKAGVLYWQRKYDELAATKTDAISG